MAWIRGGVRGLQLAEVQPPFVGHDELGVQDEVFPYECGGLGDVRERRCSVSGDLLLLEPLTSLSTTLG